MGGSKKTVDQKFSRREALKLSALALGGLAVSGSPVRAGSAPEATSCTDPGPWYPDTVDNTQTYSYFFGSTMPTFNPIDPTTHTYIPVEPNEMRITFMGSCIPPVRRSQCMMSVFVEVGNAKGEADSFVFDCGSGVCANYGAMGIGFSRMNKVFLTHLHGDHMSDLTHIYCFGPSADRKTPLYVWGPSRSGIKNPTPPPLYYDDGLTDMLKAFRKAWRWHSESFSFLKTTDGNYTPPKGSDWGLKVPLRPLGGDSRQDGYALVPIELNWRRYGNKLDDNVAYNNPATGVKITHFPVIHCRQGSIGYKLEWNGMSMIYTGDTRPETHSVAQASGVDVFIHECVVPPDVWAFKNMGLSAPPASTDPLYPVYQAALSQMQEVQESSHTPQGAFGYLLSQIQPQPKLTVATHFPVSDDTVNCALKSIKEHCPVTMDPTSGNFVFSFDLMVIKVSPDLAGGLPQQYRAVVADYGYAPFVLPPKTQELKDAKYQTPTMQIDKLDQETLIPPVDPNTGDCNYLDDGY